MLTDSDMSLKQDTVVCIVNRKLILVTNLLDDNYLPRRIVVMGGSPGNLRKLSDVTVDQ